MTLKMTEGESVCVCECAGAGGEPRHWLALTRTPSPAPLPPTLQRGEDGSGLPAPGKADAQTDRQAVGRMERANGRRGRRAGERRQIEPDGAGGRGPAALGLRPLQGIPGAVAAASLQAE